MDAQQRYQLLHGPYAPPAVELGDELECEIRGPVIVRAWSEGPIAWPLACRGGNPAYILCGDLIRAVKDESSIAIQHWFGVGKSTVCRWRKVLKVKRANEGTSRLHRAYQPETLTEEVVTRGLQKAHSLPVRLKAQQTRHERGTQPNLKLWTPEEKALLGTMPDSQVAQRVGRAAANVGIYRRKQGITSFTAARSAGARTGTRNGQETVLLDPDKLKSRRLALGISQKELARRGSLHFTMYSSLETGTRRRVWRETLHKVALALECAPGELIDNNELLDNED